QTIHYVGIAAGSALHDIIAGASDQRVVTCPPGKHVGSTIASEDVVAAVPRRVEHGRPGQHDILDFRKGSKVQIHRAVDHYRVGPFAGLLSEVVAEVVDDVGIVALAAGHSVSSEAAIQNVIARSARQQVIP